MRRRASNSLVSLMAWTIGACVMALPTRAGMRPALSLSQAVRSADVVMVGTVVQKIEESRGGVTVEGKPLITGVYRIKAVKSLMNNGGPLSEDPLLAVSDPWNDSVPPTMERPEFDVRVDPEGMYVFFFLKEPHRDQWRIVARGATRRIGSLNDPYLLAIQEALKSAAPGSSDDRSVRPSPHPAVVAVRPTRETINPLMLGAIMAQVNQKEAERKEAQREHRRKNPPSLTGVLSWQDGEHDAFLAITVEDGGRWDLDHTPSPRRDALMKLVGTTLTVQGRTMHQLTCSHGPYLRYEVTLIPAK